MLYSQAHNAWESYYKDASGAGPRYFDIFTELIHYGAERFPDAEKNYKVCCTDKHLKWITASLAQLGAQDDKRFAGLGDFKTEANTGL